jgi:hypothetical protein
MDEHDVERGRNVGKFSAAHGSDTRSRVALAKSIHVLMASYHQGDVSCSSIHNGNFIAL